MAKLTLPNEVIELSDASVEVLVLDENVKRLDIKYAPHLKKIVNLSEYLIIGPEKATGAVPVLNRCPALNEIITCGYIQFNTKIETNGKSITVAWTGLQGDNMPVLTSVGSEYLGAFPCYYYNTDCPIEEVDTSLMYAYPIIRECKKEALKPFLEASFSDVNQVVEGRLVSENDLNVMQEKVSSKFSRQVC